jgi:hypothetical protein
MAGAAEGETKMEPNAQDAPIVRLIGKMPIRKMREARRFQNARAGRLLLAGRAFPASG